MLLKLLLYKDYLSRFLEAGHNINEQDELGFTPLHLAALLERNFILKEILNWKEARKHLEDENEVSS